MTLKEKMKTDISKIIEDGKNINNKIVEISKEEFKKILNKSNVTADELRNDSKEILSGIDEGFDQEKAKTENSLHNLKEESVEKGKTIAKVAHSLVEMTKEYTDKEIENAKEKTEAAKNNLVNETEKLKGNIKNVNESYKEDVSKTIQNLHNYNTLAIKKLEAVGSGIKDYTKEKSEKLKEQVVTDLHKAADKSKEAAKHLEMTTKEFTKKILSSSLTEIENWLHNLSNKIKK